MENEKTIKVGDKEVTFRATAATARHYRNIFGRDMMEDMMNLSKEMEESDPNASTLPSGSLLIFENVAYIMAWHAAKAHGELDGFPDDPAEWLDSFEFFSIYEILPAVFELWGMNNKTLVKSKKK